MNNSRNSRVYINYFSYFLTKCLLSLAIGHVKVTELFPYLIFLNFLATLGPTLAAVGNALIQEDISYILFWSTKKENDCHLFYMIISSFCLQVLLVTGAHQAMCSDLVAPVLCLAPILLILITNGMTSKKYPVEVILCSSIGSIASYLVFAMNEEMTSMGMFLLLLAMSMQGCRMIILENIVQSTTYSVFEVYSKIYPAVSFVLLLVSLYYEGSSLLQEFSLLPALYPQFIAIMLLGVLVQLFELRVIQMSSSLTLVYMSAIGESVLYLVVRLLSNYLLSFYQIGWTIVILVASTAFVKLTHKSRREQRSGGLGLEQEFHSH